MSELLVPGGVLLVSLAATYYFCLRPMRRGGCGPMRREGTGDAELELALQRARLDLARLRAGVSEETGTPAEQTRRSVAFTDPH